MISPPWFTDGLCHGKSSVFFSEYIRSVRRAKEICSHCPVKHRCLERALDQREKFGVWGGMTPQERDREKRRRRRQSIPVVAVAVGG